MWGRRALGARQLWSLIFGLPPRSAYHYAIDPEGAFNHDAVRWGNVEELLAVLIEVVDVQTKAIELTHSVDGQGRRLMLKQKERPFIRVPRPGRSHGVDGNGKRGPRKATAAEIVRALGAEHIQVRKG